MATSLFKFTLLIIYVLINLTPTYSNTWISKSASVDNESRRKSHLFAKLNSYFNDPLSTPCFGALTNGIIKEKPDFGVLQFPIITGHCWYDYGKDGIQDPADKPMKDILICLLDENNFTVDSILTNSIGQFQFSEKEAGKKYRIWVKAPGNFSFTPQDASGYEHNDSDVDSDGRSGLFSINQNDSFRLDAGMFFSCNLKTTSLKLDALSANCFNGDSIEVHAYLDLTPVISPTYCLKYILTAGPSQKIVAISDQPNFFIHTDGIFNIYQIIYNAHSDDYNYLNLSLIKPGVTRIADFSTSITKNQICASLSSRPLSFFINSCIGFNGKVWMDKNENGKQDVAEQGVRNTLVFLTNDMNVILDSSKTNELGVYHFDNVSPSYKYRIVIQSISKYHFTLPNASITDLDDSDVDQYGKSEILYLSPGSKSSIDAGLVPNHIGIVSSTNFQSKFSEDFYNSNYQWHPNEIKDTRYLKKQILTLSPNPFHNKLQIIIPGNDSSLEYSILNMSNTKIKSGILKEVHNSIELNELNPGLYLFEWKSGTDNGFMKLIKI